ncbi:accessory factor associated with RNA polymerase II [Mycoemilia scoparia]|uniref:Accessory factor associated with RNA polymerase II n=1 Tax=Mycoemilia scoparia TaxID=417184 RepID=A0A9W7ZZM7_9FUNG|nr:accessory factor associated with RNA polymerase II [Mycoemilia scoparia]
MSFYSYLKSAVEVGLPGVSFADKGDIVSYLTGKTVTSNSIIKGKGSTAASAAAGSGGSGSAGGVKRHHDGKSIGSGNNTEGDSGSGVGGIGVEGDKDGGDVDGLVAAKRLKSTSGIDTSTSASGGGALLDISAEADIDASKAIEIRERVLVTSDMALKGSKSFAYVLSVVKDVFSSKSQPQGSSGSHHGSSGVGSGGYGGSESKGAHGKRKRKDPIIIVPAAATALLNMYNIKEFLQDQTFVDSKEQMDKIQIKPREVFVERKLGSASSKPIRYRVIDSTQGLGADEWDNIACVFTQGAEWQFKNWQWKTPDEVFKNCLGIFPRFPDINIRGNVQTWNVQVLDNDNNDDDSDEEEK